MAITGIDARGRVGLILFVVDGRQADAADFYRTAFDAMERRRWVDPRDGRLAAIDLDVDGAAFTVGGANPRRAADPALAGPCAVEPPGRSGAIYQLPVADVDAAVARALAAGATLRTGAEDAAWGDRVATIVDPFGHMWALSQVQRELSVEAYNAAGNIRLVAAA